MPLDVANGAKIREAMEERILCHWGTPRVLFTDNGTVFINKDLKNLEEDYGIILTTIPPYRPQADPVKCTNRVLKTIIASYMGQDDSESDLNINESKFAYNTACHSANKITPAFLNFGRNPEPKISWRRSTDEATEAELEDPEICVVRLARSENTRSWITGNMILANERQAKYYNAEKRDLAYNVRDKVYTRNRAQSDAKKKFTVK